MLSLSQNVPGYSGACPDVRCTEWLGKRITLHLGRLESGQISRIAVLGWCAVSACLLEVGPTPV